MTHKQLVERWEGQLLHWKNAGNNLTLSEEYRNKALYYASSISALLIDLKDMDEQEDTSTWISIDEQFPNEIWHNAGEPNYNTPVVVINSEGKIIYFGYYGPRGIKSGERWAYMIDLVNNTTKNK